MLENTGANCPQPGLCPAIFTSVLNFSHLQNEANCGIQSLGLLVASVCQVLRTLSVIQ